MNHMHPEERFDQGKEIKEIIPKAEIAFAFLKPDFIKDLPEVEKILNEYGLEIIYTDRVRLSPFAVDKIYKDSKQEHFYETMKDYLVKNDILVLLVGGPGHEAQKVLLSLKKENGRDGVIRQRLQKEPKVSEEDIAFWSSGQHPKQDEISIILTQKNVLHTADSTEEAMASLKLILGPKFEEIKKKGNLPAELWKLFEDDK